MVLVGTVRMSGAPSHDRIRTAARVPYAERMDALLSAATGTMPSDARRDIERWFVRRGVPQFIEGYSTEQSMDARATPYIAVWIAIWTSIWWAGRSEIPLAWRVIAALASLAVVGVAYRAIMAARRRSTASRPPKFDLTDIAAFAILPVIRRSSSGAMSSGRSSTC